MASDCNSSEIAGATGVPSAFASPEVIGVLGMHRSGTSLCMNLLQSLGVRLDDDLIPGDVNNEPGYFESRELVDLNDGILRTLGATWHTVFSLAIPDGWADDPALLPAKEALRDLITRKAVNGPGTWGFKDPRITVLLPLYEQVFAECGLLPRYILCIRDPRAVARSLNKRNQFPPLLSEILWLDYTMSAVQLGGKRLRAIVTYEKWFRDAIGQAESLVSVVGPGAAAGSLETIVQRVVAPALNHADAEAGDFALACSRSVYELLLAGDLPGAAAVFAESWQAIRLVMGPSAAREAARAHGFAEPVSARRCVPLVIPGAQGPGPGPQLRLDPPERCIPGELYSDGLCRVLNSACWKLEDLARWAEPWVEYLRTSTYSHGDGPALLEWVPGEPPPLPYVVFKGLRAALMWSGTCARPAGLQQSQVADVAFAVMRLLGLPVSSDEREMLIRQEARPLEVVRGPALEQHRRRPLELQLFWTSPLGLHFREPDSCRVRTPATTLRRTVRIEIPAGLSSTAQFRIDLSNRPGLARLFGMRLLGAGGNTIWEWDGLPASLSTAVRYDMEILSVSDSTEVTVHLLSDDPILILPIPEGALGSFAGGGAFEVDFSWIGTIVAAEA